MTMGLQLQPTTWPGPLGRSGASPVTGVQLAGNDQIGRLNPARLYNNQVLIQVGLNQAPVKHPQATEYIGCASYVCAILHNIYCFRLYIFGLPFSLFNTYLIIIIIITSRRTHE